MIYFSQFNNFLLFPSQLQADSFLENFPFIFLLNYRVSRLQYLYSPFISSQSPHDQTPDTWL